MDDVEQQHEAVRGMPFTEELARIPRQMRPTAELCSEEQAHLFVRGLTVCHMDAALRLSEAANRLLEAGFEAESARRGVEPIVNGAAG